MTTQGSGKPDRAAVLWRVVNHPVAFWALLAVPAVLLVASGVGGAEAGELLHSSGEMSVRLLILALVITPLRLLFPAHRWPRWLLARRRAIGVASFGYAALHMVFYAWFEGLLAELAAPGIATGWLALVIMAVLAITSNDLATRLLRKHWKTVQRGAYVAAVLAAAHWLLLDGAIVPVLVHFVPLLLLEGYRVIRRSNPQTRGS